MRIAYLDCFAGISGDMFLGALLDAGLDPQILHDTVSALNLGATLEVEKVNRAGITSTKVHVFEGGHLADSAPHSHEHAQPHSHSHADTDSVAEQHSHNTRTHSHQIETQHQHKTGHPHTHEAAPAAAELHTQSYDHHHHEHEEQLAAHEHHHGRSLTLIRDLIQDARLAEPIKNFAVHAFELLGASEAKIHGVPVDDIHFHEVGAVDAIVDIVCASAGIHALNGQALTETGAPLAWHSSPLNVGGGVVHCAHGLFPVPAPATADLLRGIPTYSAHLQKELVTPTGAAILRALAPTFSTQPSMRVEHIGYGAGTRNPADFPNVLRLSVGNLEETATAPSPTLPVIGIHSRPTAHQTSSHSANTDTVTVLETALDDLSPQILAFVTEQALKLGAFDVMTSAVTMKKGRLGTLLTVLTDDEHSPALERLLLRETSTLGIRIRDDRRVCLDRHHTSVDTPFGPIRIKIGSSNTEELNAAPEFEDCRVAALAHNAPLKQVLQAATAAYVNLSKE